MEKKIQKAYVYEKKELKKPEIECDQCWDSRPAWIKLKNQTDSKFLTISFGYGNIQYMQFLHSGIYTPTNHTKDEMRKLYDQFSNHYDQTVKGFGLEKDTIKKITNQFCKLGKPKTIKILDIGAGTGRGTQELAKKGYQNITLLDMSYKMLEKAKKKKHLKNCKTITAEFTQYMTKDKYDTITSYYCLGSTNYYTQQETKNCIKKIDKMLKKDGIVMGVGVGCTQPFEKTFKTIHTGELKLKKGLKTTYYIGCKKDKHPKRRQKTQTTAASKASD